MDGDNAYLVRAPSRSMSPRHLGVDEEGADRRGLKPDSGSRRRERKQREPSGLSATSSRSTLDRPSTSKSPVREDTLSPVRQKTSSSMSSRPSRQFSNDMEPPLRSSSPMPMYADPQMMDTHRYSMAPPIPMMDPSAMGTMPWIDANGQYLPPPIPGPPPLMGMEMGMGILPTHQPPMFEYGPPMYPSAYAAPGDPSPRRRTPKGSRRADYARSPGSRSSVSREEAAAESARLNLHSPHRPGSHDGSPVRSNSSKPRRERSIYSSAQPLGVGAAPDPSVLPRSRMASGASADVMLAPDQARTSRVPSERQLASRFKSVTLDDKHLAPKAEKTQLPRRASDMYFSKDEPLPEPKEDEYRSPETHVARRTKITKNRNSLFSKPQDFENSPGMAPSTGRVDDRSSTMLDAAQLTSPGTTHLIFTRTKNPTAVVPLLRTICTHQRDIAAHITHLEIARCRLKDLPSCLTFFNLTFLDISGNSFVNATLPPVISKLTRLRVLLADMCGLQTLSYPIHNLTHLRTLSLEYNNLHRVPETINSLPRLKVLFLDGNPLTGATPQAPAPPAPSDSQPFLHVDSSEFGVSPFAGTGVEPQPESAQRPGTHQGLRPGSQPSPRPASHPSPRPDSQPSSQSKDLPRPAQPAQPAQSTQLAPIDTGRSPRLGTSRVSQPGFDQLSPTASGQHERIASHSSSTSLLTASTPYYEPSSSLSNVSGSTAANENPSVIIDTAPSPDPDADSTSAANTGFDADVASPEDAQGYVDAQNKSPASQVTSPSDAKATGLGLFDTDLIEQRDASTAAENDHAPSNWTPSTASVEAFPNAPSSALASAASFDTHYSGTVPSSLQSPSGDASPDSRRKMFWGKLVKERRSRTASKSSDLASTFQRVLSSPGSSHNDPQPVSAASHDGNFPQSATSSESARPYLPGPKNILRRPMSSRNLESGRRPQPQRQRFASNVPSLDDVYSPDNGSVGLPFPAQAPSANGSEVGLLDAAAGYQPASRSVSGTTAASVSAPSVHSSLTAARPSSSREPSITHSTVSSLQTDQHSQYAEIRSQDNPSKRLHAVLEIVDTEVTYTRNLNELAAIYMYDKDATVIPEDERKSVFGHIDSILKIHTHELLPQLQRVAAPVLAQRQHASEAAVYEAALGIATVFAEFAAFFKHYSAHINNFDMDLARVQSWSANTEGKSALPFSFNAESLKSGNLSSAFGLGSNSHTKSSNNLTGLSTISGSADLNPAHFFTSTLSTSQRKRIRNFLQKAREKPNHSQISLGAYLLLPVQRIPRFLLLLQTLAECTPDLSSDEASLPHPVVYRAYTTVADVAAELNDRKRESDGRVHILMWQRRLARPSIPLVQPHRLLIKSGRATLVATEHQQSASAAPVHSNIILLLCTDILVCVRELSVEDKSQTSPVEIVELVPLKPSPAVAASAAHSIAFASSENRLRVFSQTQMILHFQFLSSRERDSWLQVINNQYREALTL